MNDKKVKIVCIGIGGYAHVYWKTFFESKEDNFEIVGAVDPYPDGAKYLSEIKDRGIPLFNSMEEFYEKEEADLAIITTPIHLHTRQTLYALEHGSNVLCEKPLSAVSTDAEIIEKRAEELGKFVMIGYQWSYSRAILSLKADILSGKLGKPLSLKTQIFWPRKKEYFTRGSGWAGKLKAKDGTPLNDSIAANACAHYIHNMLFVCGEEYLADEAKNVEADLLRVNDIENFDNATISFEVTSGAKCLFVAAHSTKKRIEPIFEYRFENGVVKYDESARQIIAYMNDGSEKYYGDPFADVAGGDKAKIAISGCLDKSFKPVCSPYTAAAHTRCIEAVQTHPVFNVNEELIKTEDTLLYVEGLEEAFEECYLRGVLLRDTEFYNKIVRRQRK